MKRLKQLWKNLVYLTKVDVNTRHVQTDQIRDAIDIMWKQSGFKQNSFENTGNRFKPTRNPKQN